MRVLVLDEHLSSKTLGAGLRARGFDVRTLQSLGLSSRPDPDVVRQIPDKLGSADWVLVTVDYPIVEEHRGFDWSRYTIAWIKYDPHLSGADVEAAKHDILHKHVQRIAEQRPGDHHTYTRRSYYRHPPSLMSRPY